VDRRRGRKKTTENGTRPTTRQPKNEKAKMKENWLGSDAADNVARPPSEGDKKKKAGKKCSKARMRLESNED